MKKLLFLFDVPSARITLTAEDFKNALPDVEVVSLDGLEPSEDALIAVHRLCDEEKPDVIIGEGIGGLLAQQMHGYHKILINPSFFLPNGSCSTNTDFIVHQFDEVTDFDRENTYAYFNDEDIRQFDYDKYYEHYPIAIHYPSGQGFEPKYVLKLIVPLINGLLKLK